MKRLLLSGLAAVSLLAATITAQAQFQSGLQSTILNGGTNNIASAATNTYLNATFTGTRASHLLVEAVFSCTASNGASVTIRFDGSLDNSNWETNAINAWAITANGTSTVLKSTNLDMLGFPFIRAEVVENPGPAAVTNLVLRAFEKVAGF